MVLWMSDLCPLLDAGAMKLELARRLEAYGICMNGLVQHAVRRFATALEIVPRTFEENALGGAEGNEVLSALLTQHKEKDEEAVGVDVEGENNGTLDARASGILDSLAAKAWATRSATDTTVSVLRVDSNRVVGMKTRGLTLYHKGGICTR